MRYISVVWMVMMVLPVWGGEKIISCDVVSFIKNGGNYNKLSPRSQDRFCAVHEAEVRKIERQNPKSYQERKELYQVGKAIWNALNERYQEIEGLYNQMLLEMREMKVETPTLSKYIDACLGGPTFVEQGIVDSRKNIARGNQQIKILDAKIQQMDKEMRREASLRHKIEESSEFSKP